MRLITSVAEMRTFSRQARESRQSLALVPTMGALHEGHLSLVRHARSGNAVVVVSIFVNPTQFGPGEDLARYPRDLDKDTALLEPLEVDAVFAPPVKEMYPPGSETFVDPGPIATKFEGAHRPGHFRGVATVVLKLLNIVQPEAAYFGQKDFQQALLIRRMIEDLNLDVRLVLCPTVREQDGLARSSRNVYLSMEERPLALTLSQALHKAQDLYHQGETRVPKLLDAMQRVFSAEPAVRVDYLTVVEPAGLQPVQQVVPGYVALVAARVGPTRLIDNLIFGPPGSSPDELLNYALTATPPTLPPPRLPGAEIKTLQARIEGCRDCAAISSIHLPPREFLTKHVHRHYMDLNSIRVALIGRDAPFNPENFLYRNPVSSNRFVNGLYELLGVQGFAEFKAHYVMTDAIRCHAVGPHVPEKALAYCAKHLREELRLFPNLETIIVLGEDAYLQFQKFILGRAPATIKPFNELLREQGWAWEEVKLPAIGERLRRVIYCYHPTFGYKRSPSLAPVLAE